MSIDAVNSTQSGTYASPPTTIILTVTLLIFFFAGFFSVFFCRCFIETMTNSWHLRRSPSGNHVSLSGANAIPGLDPSIIESFPKFLYSTVKHFRKGANDGLECAICLSEFADDDSIRLLTLCCHVFHQDCIDLWLKSHKTCPVCRRNLDAVPGDSPLKCPIMCDNSRHVSPNENGENSTGPGSISITIKDDDDNENKRREGAGNGDGSAAMDSRENVEENTSGEERFSRSHSTGHSIVRIRENEEDRYTLRLPDDVHSRITRRHNWTKSCTEIGNFSTTSNMAAATRKDGGFGEVSGGSGGDDNKV